MDGLRELTRDKDLGALRNWLGEHGTLDIAEELARVPPAERAIAFRLLAKDRALAVFEALEPLYQQELLDGLRDAQVRSLVEEMEPDDRVRLFDEMPATVVTRIQAGLSSSEREATASLLGYPTESAGRVMTPSFVSVRSSMTAADALSKVRRTDVDPAVLHVLPVTDDQRRLKGMVDLRHLVSAPSSTRIGDLVGREVYSVTADTDQEEAARLMRTADLVELPVVDAEDRLLGVITVDDAMRVLDEEMTEDLARTGGSEPLGRPYLGSSAFHLARKRAVWLLLLGVAAVLTVNVLAAFEGTLESVVALALFIPLLIDTGGNSGSQAATVVIRAMSVGEVRFRDLPTVVWREARVGFMLGLMLAVIAFPAVWLFFDVQFATIIASTIAVICLWASFVGGLLPMLAQRVGIDPAVVSAPLITTLIDATGLILYFMIATAVLGL